MKEQANEPFFRRFHRLKVEARQQQEAASESQAITGVPAAKAEADVPAPLTDADMPPLESLSFDSDFTGFLSEEVSDSLRRMALRKLFHSAEFNIVDGLDEYAEDYTNFTALGDIITSDMRHQMEEAAKREAEKLKASVLEETSEPEPEPEAEQMQEGQPLIVLENQNPHS